MNNIYLRHAYPNELYHHGIKGQRWGIRRFQNPDGSLTTSGKERYSKKEKNGSFGSNTLITYTSRGKRYVDTGKISKYNGVPYVMLDGPDVDETGLPVDEIIDLYRSGVSTGAIAERFKGAIPREVVEAIAFGTPWNIESHYETVRGRLNKERAALDENTRTASRVTADNMKKRGESPKTHRYDANHDGNVSAREALKGVSNDAKKIAKKILKSISSLFN